MLRTHKRPASRTKWPSCHVTRFAGHLSKPGAKKRLQRSAGKWRRSAFDHFILHRDINNPTLRDINNPTLRNVYNPILHRDVNNPILHRDVNNLILQRDVSGIKRSLDFAFLIPFHFDFETKWT